MVSTATSGNCSVTKIGPHQLIEQGLEGLTMSDLRPGGRAQFGDQLMDVLTQGELISKGVRVRVLHHSNGRPVVVEA
jgi:membrane-bound serine protease (ClpP class)